MFDASSRPSLAHFLACMSEPQRLEYVRARDALRYTQALADDTYATMHLYALGQYAWLNTHPLTVLGAAPREAQQQFEQKRGERQRSASAVRRAPSPRRSKSRSRSASRRVDSRPDVAQGADQLTQAVWSDNTLKSELQR